MLSVVLLGPSNWSSFPWQVVNDGQQAALQSVENFLYLALHIFLHLWPPPPLHLRSILFLSFLVHVFSSSSAVQSFSDESMSGGNGNGDGAVGVGGGEAVGGGGEAVGGGGEAVGGRPEMEPLPWVAEALMVKPVLSMSVKSAPSNLTRALAIQDFARMSALLKSALDKSAFLKSTSP